MLMEAVTFEELKAVVESVARWCKGCMNRGSGCNRCDRLQCRMLAERFADATRPVQQTLILIQCPTTWCY